MLGTTMAILLAATEIKLEMAMMVNIMRMTVGEKITPVTVVVTAAMTEVVTRTQN